MKTYTFNNGWTYSPEPDGDDEDLSYLFEELTGRVIYGWQSKDDQEYEWNQGQLVLWCGPEEDDHLHDSVDVYDNLRPLLPFAEIGSAENYHMIEKSDLEAHFGVQNISLEDAKARVAKLLTDAGVVYSDMGMDEDEG